MRIHNWWRNFIPVDAPEIYKPAYALPITRNYATVFQRIEEKSHPLIDDTKDKKAAWNILKETFVSFSSSRLAGLQEKENREKEIYK